jgi:DNA-binding MarR family transcriptional regulator
MKPSPAARSTDAATRAGQDIISMIGRLRRRIREVSTSDDLSPAQTSVLVLLGKNGAATASALATAEGVRPQSMATTLTALERQGLIQRHADPHDGRRQLVTLTAEGEAVFNGNRAARQEWLISRIRHTLTPAETRTLIEAAALLDRLIQP